MEIELICSKVRGKRSEKRITQKEMADYIGISARAYNYKENNKCSFTVEELMKIASYLKCDIKDFF